MASQRITIAKIGGVAADVAFLRLKEWAEARTVADPNEWSSDQWPSSVRIQVDAFADRIRGNALSLPVIHFVEWADMWSMGDLFDRWLTPPGGPSPLQIHADRFEVYAYSLPDGSRLERYLSTARRRRFVADAQFVGQLREAVTAWQIYAERAVIIVLRKVVGGSVLVEELIDSLSYVPDWLSET